MFDPSLKVHVKLLLCTIFYYLRQSMKTMFWYYMYIKSVLYTNYNLKIKKLKYLKLKLEYTSLLAYNLEEKSW